ncbi:hypothetical protein IEO21_02162 [Rhodonia placenta]|uniref:C2H2-type domain-containing protein n=1 Tax=Rhodonia placenta TaxID=104341 RepID=A0A8H7U574_9APHY|nr:hypothetical protein IEO21_02162 [Postia placenta]
MAESHDGEGGAWGYSRVDGGDVPSSSIHSSNRVNTTPAMYKYHEASLQNQYAQAPPTFAAQQSTMQHSHYAIPAASNVNFAPQITQNYPTIAQGYPAMASGHVQETLPVQTYSYHPPPATLVSPPHVPQPKPTSNHILCRWRQCGLVLDDLEPSGIARHLKEYHFDDLSGANPWHNKNRGLCEWWDWDGECRRDMNYASFAKHIASVHLRSTAARCPYCQHELGRRDSLERHIKNYCSQRPQCPPFDDCCEFSVRQQGEHSPCCVDTGLPPMQATEANGGDDRTFNYQIFALTVCTCTCPGTRR